MTRSLDELGSLVVERQDLYVRWSGGPAADLCSPTSTDHLTGVPLPGLSVNALALEPWWGDRPVGLWVARRLYDYSHLRRDRDGDVRPWTLSGREAGRGPDNEPLLCEVRPVSWIDLAVIDDAVREVMRLRRSWGPMRR
ncbi:DUF6098 family protein [Streptomyces sp. NPDC051322]|uniref:DUF6098 family protein n=1 Tax=Streptomyces sp. NPDC051322 TaxID=3154645 RepID=UPI00344F7F3C